MDSSSDDDEPILICTVPPDSKKVLDEATFNQSLGDIISRDFYIEKPIYDSTTNPWRTMDYSMSESTSRETPTTRTNWTADSRKPELPSLNEFLSKFVSEDDAYFHALDLKKLARYRAKHPWMFRDGQTNNSKVSEQLKVPSIGDQAVAGIDGKVKEPITWPHNPQGHLFFPPQVPPKKNSSTVNYNSNRLHRNMLLAENLSGSHPTSILFAKPNKIGIDGKPEDELFRDGKSDQLSNNSSLFNVQTDLAFLTPHLKQDNREPGTSTPNTGQNRYYLPDASPRDDLAHRIYEEKVAEAIRTPKRKKTSNTGSMSSVRSSSIFSTNSDRISQVLMSKREKARKRWNE